MDDMGNYYSEAFFDPMKDQVKVWKEEIETVESYEIPPDDTGLQDGMLAYYQSQCVFTDWHEQYRLAREYFDCRDMLETEKK